MLSHAFVASMLAPAGLSLALTLAVTTAGAGRTAGTETAMSCFVIGGTVACIDAGYVPPVPVVPSVTAPMGPDFTGESEDIVIRDDGGRQVASG